MEFKEQVHFLGYIAQPQPDLVKWGSPTVKAANNGLPLPGDFVPPLPRKDKSRGGPSLEALLEWSKQTDFGSRNSNLDYLTRLELITWEHSKERFFAKNCRTQKGDFEEHPNLP